MKSELFSTPKIYESLKFFAHIIVPESIFPPTKTYLIIIYKTFLVIIIEDSPEQFQVGRYDYRECKMRENPLFS